MWFAGYLVAATQAAWPSARHFGLALATTKAVAGCARAHIYRRAWFLLLFFTRPHVRNVKVSTRGNLVDSTVCTTHRLFKRSARRAASVRARASRVWLWCVPTDERVSATSTNRGSPAIIIMPFGLFDPPPPPPPTVVPIGEELAHILKANILPVLSYVGSPMFLLAVLLLSPCMYLLLNSVIPTLLGSQNLKKKYNATWALVTGSSSGIGKELARKLLGQGLNVILVAREELLSTRRGRSWLQHLSQSVLQVNANLSDPSGAWMDGVKATVGDKDVQCVFLNAGFILTGMYEQHPLPAHLANLHCNLTSNIWLSHFFYERLVAKQLKGCIVFTSSPASYLPNPFAALYAATKSGVSALASSLAVEARPRGIHVHSIHPSPVNSRSPRAAATTSRTRRRWRPWRCSTSSRPGRSRCPTSFSSISVAARSWQTWAA